jgi:hypothetical protein
VEWTWRVPVEEVDGEGEVAEDVGYGTEPVK